MTITAPPVADALATATARKRPDGSWRVEDEDWGTFTGPSLTAAYTAAAAYRAASGETGVLVVRLHRPGAVPDWQVLERLGYLCDEDEPVPAEVTNPGASPCGHPPRCACPTPSISPSRLDSLAADWGAEVARANLRTGSDKERGGR